MTRRYFAGVEELLVLSVEELRRSLHKHARRCWCCRLGARLQYCLRAERVQQEIASAQRVKGRS